MRVAKYVVTFIIGGMICWIPSVALHWAHGYQFDGNDVILLTVCMPFFGFLALKIARRIVPRDRTGTLVGILVIAGLWLIGPWAMFLSATASGGGFAIYGSPNELAMLMIPGIAFIFGTYDGSLVGILATTAGIAILSQSKQFLAQ